MKPHCLTRIGVVLFLIMGFGITPAFSGGMPPREMLVDTDWYWVQSLYNNDTQQTPKDPAHYMLRFNMDGTFTGRADCNRIRGQYRIDQHKISISEVISTRAMCPEDSLEQSFLKDLGKAASFFFKGDDLYFELKMHSGSMKFSLEDTPVKVFIPCKDPRPEICTMEYDPVCGKKADGTTATYGNACEACADKTVTGYYPGECP